VTRPVAVAGAGAISAYGAGWHGLGSAMLAGEPPREGVMDSPQGGASQSDEKLGNPRARKMMSRSAYLAALCLRQLLQDVGWHEGRARIGYYLGVGASGGSMADFTAMLRASIVDSRFSLKRFGEQGLAACNPLLAFQLMNNFALCHGAILEGVGGPNSAFFSRGTGTTAALIEAVQAIRDGECERAVAGGADSAHHPVTEAELARGGYVAQGLVPAEGAALLALTAGDLGVGLIEGCAVVSSHGRSPAEAVSEVMHHAAPDLSGVDLLVIAPWGPPARDELSACLKRDVPSATLLDVSATLGDALAASPALAWVAALDLIHQQRARRALVLNAGIDGDLSAVVLSRGAS
jgi:hypothetical protein